MHDAADLTCPCGISGLSDRVTVNRGSGYEVQLAVAQGITSGNLGWRTSDHFDLECSGVDHEDSVFRQAPDPAGFVNRGAVVNDSCKGHRPFLCYLARGWVEFEERCVGNPVNQAIRRRDEICDAGCATYGREVEILLMGLRIPDDQFGIPLGRAATASACYGCSAKDESMPRRKRDDAL